MNNDRIKVLTNIYLLRYDDLTAGSEDPRRRYRATADCVHRWDIEAEDFGAMFRSAMEGARYFVQPETGTSLPVDGIEALCDAGYAEEVRQQFEGLLMDESDIASRYEKILEFVNEINALLAQIMPQQWRYRQKVQDGMGYLAFIHPADNYAYRASETAAFSGYTEVEEEIGYDRSFSMTNYYRNCSELSMYLLTRTDLRDKITSALSESGEGAESVSPVEFDPEMHLAAVDLIHCAYACGFYDDKAANRKSRISTASQRRIERARQTAQFLDQREKVVDRLEEVRVQEESAALANLKGRLVRHKTFGEGTVTTHDGKYLTVTFPSAVKKFALPGVVVNGYLTFEDADKVAASCEEMQKVCDAKRRITDELNAIDVQLRMLE